MEHVRTNCEHAERIVILRIMPDADRNYVSPNTDNRSTSAEGNRLIVCLFKRLSFGLHTITFSFVTQYIAHNSWNGLYVVTCLNCQRFRRYLCLCGRRKKMLTDLRQNSVRTAQKNNRDTTILFVLYIELTDCVPCLLHVPHQILSCAICKGIHG